MKERLFKIILMFLLGLFGGYGYYFFYLNYGFGIPCLFYKITGFLCPGCGITRCIFSLFQGNVYEAYCYNRMVFFLFPWIGLYFGYRVFLYLFDKKDRILVRVPNWFWGILIGFVIIFGIVRNII